MEQSTESPPRAGHEASSPSDPPPLRLTSELELLISGALIFSLLQIPERLMGFALSAVRRLSDDLGLVPFFAAYLGTLLAFLLTASFVVHFLARSFWVALRGLNNVFPGGVDWQRLDAGPMNKTALREILPTTRQLEERADRFASTIFSVLFYMLFSLIAIFALLAIAAGLLWLVVSLLGIEVGGMAVFYTALVLFMTPMLLVALLDGFYKRRPPDLDRPSRLFRLGRRVIRGYQALLGGRLYTPIGLVFATRFSTARTGVASAVLMFVLVGLFVVSFLVAGDFIGYDSYHYLPDAAAAGELDDASYVDRRPPSLRPSLRPTIQSAVVAGPYLELFVPYDVDRDTERLLRACPDLEPARAEGLHRVARWPLPEAEERQRLDCLRRIYRVEIDGVAVPEFAPVLARDRATGLRGVVGFLPVRDLAPGPHVLTVGRDVPPEGGPSGATGGSDRNRDESGEEAEEEPARLVVQIPFWN